LVRNTIWLGLALLWTLTIAVLCLVTFGSLPHVKIPNADKFVHATLHFVFTVLWVACIGYRYPGKSGFSVRLSVLIASALYGGAIEIAQGIFTTTRDPDWHDEAANITGALTAVLLLWLASRLKRPKN
jgi:VanZ family protein